MNRHLEEYLVKKYPKIFADYGGDPRKTCMAWGMDCGDGWFFILDALCTRIQNYIDNPPYIYKKTFRIYCARVWNWIVETLHFPDQWIYWRELFEPGPPVPQVVAHQVKEKFGGLRFYYSGGDDYIRGLVGMAEAMAYRTCEECGVTNEFVTQSSGGWIRTTCPHCVESHLKQNHLENRDETMVKLWKLVKKDRRNDRKKQTV